MYVRYVAGLKRRFFKLCYMFFCILPISRKKISIASDSRSELNGNLLFVYKELQSRQLNVKTNFFLNKRIDNKKSFLYLIRMAFHFATSKIILLDDFYPLIYPLRIRRKADLIQVWHAAGAFKTFGYSRVEKKSNPYIKSQDHKNYTKVVVSSELVREKYAEGFGITVDKVYAAGIPRTDVFFDGSYKSCVKETFYKKYPFLKNKKVILFAPTFRGYGQSTAYYPYENIEFDTLYDALHGDYVFLFKIHPFVKNKFSVPSEYSDFFFDFSNHPEINDLLFITDILITDYSSVCFEFALLNRPILFFAFDLETYIKQRDFYYDYFSFIPGPLVRTTEAIVNVIKKGQFELYKIPPFVKYFFDDNLGHASQNVVDKVIIPSLKTEDDE